MVNPFQPGDEKEYVVTVSEDDVAEFASGQVHPVYATFALARDAEWTTRQFVLEMKEDDEEGIGTYINVEHLSPALVGSEVRFVGTVKQVEGHEIVCAYEAYVGDRMVARGETGQKILKKDKFDRLFESLS